MAQFPAESIFSFHDVAVKDDAAAVAGPDDDGNGGLPAARAEDCVVAPERGRVGVVQIGHRFAKPTGQPFADVESRPLGVHKIRGTPRAELACGAGRTGSIEADGDNLVKAQAGFLGGEFEAVGDLLQADIGALLREGGVLAQTLHQKLFIAIEQCVVDRGST